MPVAAELEVGEEGLRDEIRGEDGAADLEGAAGDFLVDSEEVPGSPGPLAMPAWTSKAGLLPSNTRNKARSAATSSKTISAIRARRRCVMVFCGRCPCLTIQRSGVRFSHSCVLPRESPRIGPRHSRPAAPPVEEASMTKIARSWGSCACADMGRFQQKPTLADALKRARVLAIPETAVRSTGPWPRKLRRDPGAAGRDPNDQARSCGRTRCLPHRRRRREARLRALGRGAPEGGREGLDVPQARGRRLGELATSAPHLLYALYRLLKDDWLGLDAAGFREGQGRRRRVSRLEAATTTWPTEARSGGYDPEASSASWPVSASATSP